MRAAAPPARSGGNVGAVRQFVEHVGVDVDVVGPDDRAPVGVDANLRKGRRIAERREDPGSSPDTHRAPSTNPVVPSANASFSRVRWYDLDRGDARMGWDHASFQGRNSYGRLLSSDPVPVGQQLRLVQAGPFDDKGE